MNADERQQVLAAVEAAVEAGGDADDILRAVLAVLHEHGVGSAAIRFVEGDELVDGPSAGEGDGATSVPVTFEGRTVGELALSVDDPELAGRVAALIAPYVLVGWDTGGEAWEP